ncbi:MAG: alpha/beta fold hydrolase [Pseudomonadota bacterium]
MTTVLLLHAYPLSSAMWSAQLAALQAAGHQVLTPDHPGFGTVPALDSPSMDGFALHALRALDEARVDRAVICGLSMGGYVAFRILALAPQRVAGLVFANTRAEADSDEARQRRFDQIARIEREGTGWLSEAMLPVLLGPRANAALRASVQAMIAQAPAAGVIGALRAMAGRPSSENLLPVIQVPTAFISGEHDGLTPPAVMRPMKQQVEGARCTNLANAGHLSNLESPAVFNQVLLELVDRAS